MRHDIITIELDKTGGLTEALVLAAAAIVDLDGLLLPAHDHAPGVAYVGSMKSPPPSGFYPLGLNATAGAICIVRG